MKKIILLFLIIGIGFTSCKIGRFVIYNFADVKDYKKFPKRDLEKGDTPFRFVEAIKESAPKTLTINKTKKVDFDTYLEDNKTLAFLIIQNDTLKYQRYFKQYDSSSIIPSFSMAKSVTSLLIGFAIQDGLIKSVDEPVTNYIPELKKQGFDKVSIEHLLQMTSGMKFNESYVNPFGHAATYYYGRNLRRTISKAKLEHEPGSYFSYQSGSTQLLGLVLERALKNKTITSYLQNKLWTPLGMEYNASWSLDKKKNGLEKTFCCINARAIDFAKIGRFVLQKGEWNGTQLLNKAWIEQSTKVDDSNGAARNYQYQWWLPNETGTYTAEGILGQYIYVDPSKNLIIVRMGSNYGKTSWKAVFGAIATKF